MDVNVLGNHSFLWSLFKFNKNKNEKYERGTKNWYWFFLIIITADCQPPSGKEPISANDFQTACKKPMIPYCCNELLDYCVMYTPTTNFSKFVSEGLWLRLIVKDLCLIFRSIFLFICFQLILHSSTLSLSFPHTYSTHSERFPSNYNVTYLCERERERERIQLISW